MPIILDGTAGITTPMYGGSIAANAVTPVTGFKNRLINGAMVINQRAGGTVTINSAAWTYVTDRFCFLGQSTDGVFTAQQSSTAPAGFNNSLLVTVTTADASIGASQIYTLRHTIEGYNVADLNWGTSDAKAVTLSFWVRSSVTGTFSGCFNNEGTASYPFTYAISSANTWEQKTITVAGPTSGTWGTTNSNGIRLTWSLGVGSTYSGTASAWNYSTEYFAASSTTNLISTNGATFYITGVQLEVGSTATSFDYRPYGTELALCQRYYQSNYPSGVAAGSNVGTEYELYTAAYYGPIAKAQCNVIKFFPPLRASPTITFYNRSGTSGQWYWGPYGAGESSVSTTVPNPGSNCGFVAQGNSPLAGTNIGYGYYTASAEL